MLHQILTTRPLPASIRISLSSTALPTTCLAAWACLASVSAVFPAQFMHCLADRDEGFGNRSTSSGPGGIFGRMESMMSGMHREFEQSFKRAQDMMADAERYPGWNSTHSYRSGQPGHYYKQTYVAKMIPGQNGHTEVERYEDKVAKAIGSGGHRVAERQQLYQNSATGYEKAGHERMLDGQGRKVVHEKISSTGQQRFTDFYKNIEEGRVEFSRTPLVDKARVFDGRWGRAAREMGLGTNTSSLALPYGSDYGGRVHGNVDYRQPAPAVGYNDSQRRAYIPDRLKREDAPVNYRPTGALPLDYQPRPGRLRAPAGPAFPALPEPESTNTDANVNNNPRPRAYI